MGSGRVVWVEVGVEQRSRQQVAKRGVPYRSWTDDEVSILREAMDAGLKAKAIRDSGRLPDRTLSQINGKLSNLRMNPNAGSRGGYHKWTDEERQVINTSLLEGKTYRQVYEAGLLPGRSLTQCKNGFAQAKREIDGRCLCGNDVEHGRRRCVECRIKSKEDRDALKRAGKCVACRKPNTDGSLTLCSSCLERGREQQREYLERRRAKESEAKVGTIKRKSGGGHHVRGVPVIRWTGCAAPRQLFELAPSTNHTFVDVFGGCGRFAMWAQHEGYKQVVYNDLHPILPIFMRMLKEGRSREIHEICLTHAKMPAAGVLQRYERAFDGSGSDIERAALLYTVTYSNRRNSMYAKVMPVVKMPSDALIRRPRKLRELTESIEIENEDWAEIASRWDGPDTFFFLDPPYPGTMTYEHNFELSEYRHIAQFMNECEGHFMLVLPLTRSVAELLCGNRHHIVQRIVREHGRTVRDVIVTNYELPTAKGLSPFDPSKFGLENARHVLPRKVLDLESLNGNANEVIRNHLAQGFEVVFRPPDAQEPMGSTQVEAPHEGNPRPDPAASGP